MTSDDKLRQIDATYKPFPPFREWAKHELDLTRWNRYSQQLKDKQAQSTPELLKQAQDIVGRAAAVDTGAIEGLYETDRGFTFTVAMEAAMWRSYVEEQKGEEVRDYIQAQLDAYEYILDLATGTSPITEASIRELHEIMCRNQETYAVMTSLGPQQRPLPKGKYKSNPNHVRTRTGEEHAYAPVDMTPFEMQRLIDEMRTEEFTNAHPVLQASYAHYAFVVIHPFADGNGRVARAIASIFTYQSHSVPILILNDKRDQYLDALALTDKGDNSAFIAFIFEEVLNSIQLFSDGIATVQKPDFESSFQNLTQLYKTSSGYSHEKIDAAANSLAHLVRDEFSRYFIENLDDTIFHSVSVENSLGNQSTKDAFESYRFLRNGNCVILKVDLSTKKLLSNVRRQKNFFIIIPKNASLEDDYLFLDQENSILFEVRLSEILPSISSVVEMRVRLLVDALVREMLDEVYHEAHKRNGDL